MGDEMRLVGLCAAILACCAMLAGSAGAATITGHYSLSATNVTPGSPFDPITLAFDISYDPTVAVSKDTTIITNFTSNFSSSGPIYFTNNPGSASYLTNAFSGNFAAGNDAFRFTINPDNSPFEIVYSQVGSPIVYYANHFTWSLTPTPIPGAALMLMTALASLGGLTWWRAQKLRRRGVATIAA